MNPLIYTHNLVFTPPPPSLSPTCFHMLLPSASFFLLKLVKRQQIGASIIIHLTQECDSLFFRYILCLLIHILLPSEIEDRFWIWLSLFQLLLKAICQWKSSAKWFPDKDGLIQRDERKTERAVTLGPVSLNHNRYQVWLLSSILNLSHQKRRRYCRKNTAKN